MTDIPAGPPVSPTPPLPPAPSLPPQPYQGPGGAAPIEVGFAGPAAQRRLTVLIRLILVIPQFIVLYVLAIAADFVLLIGWFGALFTGALPQFAADFLTGVLRWQARVSAYLLLLTDQYPPFSFDDADYPVRVAAQPGPLNRLAVLFRIFLAFPAAIVVGVLAYGLETIALFVIWLIVLITGRMPGSLHAAMSAVLRYTIRYTGYFYMLTSEYPGGLFGDQPPPWGLPGTAPYPAGSPAAGAGYPPAAGYPSAAGYPPAPAQPPAGDDQQFSGAEGYQQASGTGPEPASGTGPTSGWGQPEPGWGQPTPPGSTMPAGTPTPPQGTPSSPYGTPPPPYGTPSSPYGTSPTAYGMPTAAHGTPMPPYGTPRPAYGTPAAAYGMQPGPGYGTPTAVSTADWSVPGGPPWRLVLPQAARRLVTLFIVLGVVFSVGYIVVLAVVVGIAGSGVVGRADALARTNVAFGRLNTSMNTFGSQSTACRTSSHPLRCITKADQQASQAFGTFAQAQGAIGMPAGSPQAAASQLIGGATRAQHIFQQLAASTSITQYEQTLSAANLQQVLNQIEQSYRRLQTTLENG